MNLTCSKLWSTRLPRLGKSFIAWASSLFSAFSGSRGRNKASVRGFVPMTGPAPTQRMHARRIQEASNFLAAALFAGCILWPAASPAASSLPTNEVALLQAIYTVLHDISDGTSSPVVYPVDDNWMNIGTMMEEGLFTPSGMGGHSSLLMLLWSIYGVEPSGSNLPTGEQALLPLLRKWLPIAATNGWSQADIDSVVNALYGPNQSVGNNVETIRNVLETLASSNQMARVEELLGTIDEDLPSAQDVNDMATAMIAIYESAPESDWQSLLAHVDASAALFDHRSVANVVYDGSEPSRAINVHVDFDTMSDLADIVETFLGDQTDTIMSFLTGHPWEPDSDHFFEGSVTNDLSDILERLDLIVGFDTNDVANAFRVFASGFATNNLHLANIVDELGYTNTARSVAVDFSNLLARLDNIRSNDLQSSSLAVLERDSAIGYGDSYDYGLTNAPLPQYEDPIANVDTSSMSSSIEAGQSTFEDVAEDLKALIRPTQADDEIVLIPEMTIGGIHVDEYRAHLGTSITPVCRRIMQFIWGVSLFAALFGLASAEWAFYANLGRNWTMSGGFHEKGAP